MEKLTRYTSILVLTAVLAGCSAMDLVNPGGPQVNTNAQVGQENTQQVVANQTSNDVEGDQNNSRDAIEVREGGVTINNTPMWLVVLLVLGWVLPTPWTMLKGLWYALPFTRKPKKK